ncbi:MAG: DUF92 domain-containing protein [Chlorobium sp.]|uniref:DUF92 domain-containing protein n=1 Tax=Chlorobium sp. TaxID=1095 RepID=UPI0025C6DB7D|nr:DUF92 domain-containing protein [Chlorobium sp.]MCF8216942.1 DUF92 domain-containing protein [Chlorobium sp.]MCF8271771.1 DUF92 domain-containing protein [Chlorobium sp.]MCF8288159.1 DUF92 domain-containing protein [Chlorobium sp.]MCF8291750.1 DUF92 domain-containing protein [Chlorobium sp.]MCF8385842.1 DUF92 domain-containing protein [Chlorobium sp.]
MLHLQAPQAQDLPAFFMTLTLSAFFIILGELLIRKFGVKAFAVRKIIHLGMGIIVFFVPDYFESNFYPVAAALFFVVLNGFNVLTGRLLSLHKETVEPERGKGVNSYGSVLFPLVFLILALLLWESHKWILQTSMLIMGVGDSLAAIVGSTAGRRHIEHLTKSPKTVEGSAVMFAISFILILLCLSIFQPDSTGSLFSRPMWVVVLFALFLALVATAVEALLSYGLDNFFIPLSIAYALYVLEVNHTVLLENFLLGGLFALILALFSIKVKFLNNSGAVATFLLGTTIFGIGGITWTVPLLTFYLLSSVLSKLGKQRKAKFDLVFEKGSQRDAGQVYANGGIAWILMVVFSLTNDPAVFFAYMGTLAAVQADTWATEIGTMWPDPKAWLITSLKEVPVGTSGGVSVPGTSGAFIGSLFICASALPVDAGWLYQFGVVQSLLLIGVSGLVASLVDSFFGATVQAQYYDPIREKVTERTHSAAPDGSLVENRLLKGVAFVNNDLVNTLCAVSGSALAYIVIANLSIFK